MTAGEKKQLSALTGLVTALGGPKAKKLKAEVTQAFSEPATYVKKHKKALNERNISAPTPELPWISMIDGLAKLKVSFGLDWKADAEDVAWAISKLGGPKKPKWLAGADLDDRSTWELLELAGKELGKAGKRLASLDTASDEYNLVLFSKKKLAGVKKLVKAAKQQLEIFTGARLAAATKQRIARDNPTPGAQPEPQWRRFANGGEVRALMVAETGLSHDRESETVKVFTMCTYPDVATTQAQARALVEAWLALGFKEISEAQAKAIPRCAGSSIGELPGDASYFLEDRGAVKLVHAFALRRAEFWSTKGVAKESFGELISIETRATEAEAKQRFDHALETAKAFKWQALTRAEVLALYPR